MEDLTARAADPRDATRPLTPEQALSGVRGLARMHKSTGVNGLSDEARLDWVEPFVPWDGMRYAPAARFDPGGCRPTRRPR